MEFKVVKVTDEKILIQNECVGIGTLPADTSCLVDIKEGDTLVLLNKKDFVCIAKADTGVELCSSDLDQIWEGPCKIVKLTIES
jgi:hypothetical protein